MGYHPRPAAAPALRIPPMLTKRARRACWIGSLFVLYAAGVTGATWLTLVWLGWLAIMLQQWRAHRLDYRARVAQRGTDVAFWRRALHEGGLCERQAAADMLTYLGLDVAHDPAHRLVPVRPYPSAERRITDWAGERYRRALFLRHKTTAELCDLLRLLYTRPPTDNVIAERLAAIDVLRSRGVTDIDEPEVAELRGGDGQILRYELLN